MVFCVIVSEIVGAWTPVNKKIALAHSILDPIEAHVHCFGALLLDCVVRKAGGGGVVGLDGCWWLWMAKFL